MENFMFFEKHLIMNEAGDGDNGGGSSESETSDMSESIDGSEGEAEVIPAALEKKRIKQLKLKFMGKEVIEDLPFEIDEEHAEWYTKNLQMAKLSQHKSQEYGQLEREVSAFIQELRQNPKKALSNKAIGIDVKQLAAEILQEEMEQAQKSPEQIKQEEVEAELAELKAEREREKADNAAKELERLTEREYERYDNLMATALETSDLPKSPYIVKKMTEYMMLGIENGLDIDPRDVVPLVRQEVFNDLQEMFQVMPAEAIEKIIGKSTLDKLRKTRVAGAKPPVPVKAAISDVGKTASKQSATVDKKQTIKDFFGV